MFINFLSIRKAAIAVSVCSVLSSASAFAEAEINPCSTLDSSNNILKCALQNSSNIQLQKSSVAVGVKAIDAASQRPNPELELETIKNSDSDFTTSVKLLHPFELGGKRSARINAAKNKKTILEIGVLKEQEEVAVETVLNLYRLRQIETELGVIKEILNSFDKVSRQYQSAKYLNPEQEASLAIFKLAFEENKLKENFLINKKKSLVTDLEQATGTDIKVTNNILPKFKKDWPELLHSDLAGSDIQALKSNVANAQTEYELEKSQAWSNIAIGPKIERTTGVIDETMYGVALSLPLPLYQTNQGNRARALEEVRRSELALDLNKQNLGRQKSLLYEVYEQSSSSIKTSFNQNSIEARHSNIHKLIQKGFISTSLVIELHRQILDFYQTLHEQELQGVEALWRIYTLEGRILTEELK